jgi:hypothetical protein
MRRLVSIASMVLLMSGSSPAQDDATLLRKELDILKPLVGKT